MAFCVRLGALFFWSIMLHASSRSFLQASGLSASTFRFLRHFSGKSSFGFSDTLKLDVSAAKAEAFQGDLIVVPFLKPKSGDKTDQFLADLKASIPSGLSEAMKSSIGDVLGDRNFKADSKSSKTFRIFDKSSPVKYVSLVGLGTASDETAAKANQLGKTIAGIAKELKASSVGVVLSHETESNEVSQLILGAHDAAYLDNRYRKVPEGGFPPNTFSSLKLLGVSDVVAKSIGETHRRASAVADGVQWAKDMVGSPSNFKTPLEIANQARKIASDYGLQINVLGETECKALGMGGYLGVQQGSAFPPQFIHMTYRGKVTGAPEEVVKVALIGKGLTFDSGGYNLKVGAGSQIEMMKIDMGGCAAVLGCAKVLGQLRPDNVEVHFISAVCENMVSAQAMRPGDVLVASNGKTIEVGNTDAEGRLTLADALVYAEKLEVDSIIDLATLTGACVVALGEKVAALYASDAALAGEIEAASQRTRDQVWRMPLEASYRENIKSNIADIKNTGARGGGSITAALFLQEFVTSTPWAHIDMAGPVWDTKKPTGFGVKLLVDYVLNAKKKKASTKE